MGHIANMGHSLDAIKYIVDLHVAIGSSPFVDIHIKETYPFFDEDAYKQEVEDYLIKHNNDVLTRILKQHLSTCEQIIEEWEGRLELWEARSRLTDKENGVDIDSNVFYDIYCILGGKRNNIRHFYGDIMLLRNKNGKIEERNPFMPFTLFDKSWSEYNPEIRSIPDTDKKTLTVHLVRNAEYIRRFLSESVVSKVEGVQAIEKPLQQMIIPKNVLTWLQESICTNGKTYIEDATAKRFKWLQNKQLARELLTHEKIKGSLTNAEVERQTPYIFIYQETNIPLRLAKNKYAASIDSEKLRDYLATLQVADL
ncbi:hypothetical protein [Dysgonomonas sp. BGC7]|uniref:hypothetical protein n=1 Tax=Dysgonomonas sp. BGC7 TaxID=1658008 RepID=UPI000680BDFB|nr:hypothetical protein [Dysgonomonas sp. BGC7]MBD8387921.1 hypothetical protein [Dysgonomonas sp. BGC7]